jgi:hypothetical protein
MMPLMRKILAAILAIGGMAMAHGKTPEFSIQSSMIRDNSFMSALVANSRCGGENVSPDLEWENVPPDAKSLALVVHDPDSKTEGGFFHWIVVDIPPNIEDVMAGSAFEQPARAIANDFGFSEYDGPCPPVGGGPHHYHFTIYALGVEVLELDSNLTPRQVVDAIKAHAIGRATITGLYERK